MRKESKVTQIVSKDEAVVISLEQRKAGAESEYLTLCEDKKTILNSIKELDVSIVSNNKIIEEQNKEIALKKIDINSLDKTISEKSIELSNINNKIKVAKEEHASFLTSDKNSRMLIEEDFIVFKNNISVKKDALEKEKSDIEKDINSLKEEYKNTSAKITYIEEEIKTSSLLKAKLEADIVILTTKYSSLSDKFKDLQDLVKQENETISKKDADIIFIEGQIATAKNDLDSLSVSIESKKSELKDLEQQLFIVSEKQSVLNQKEAFIKAQYDRAGIKWVE